MISTVPVVAVGVTGVVRVMIGVGLATLLIVVCVRVCVWMRVRVCVMVGVRACRLGVPVYQGVSPSPVAE
jgi:hypothetical protein